MPLPPAALPGYQGRRAPIQPRPKRRIHELLDAAKSLDAALRAHRICAGDGEVVEVDNDWSAAERYDRLPLS